MPWPLVSNKPFFVEKRDLLYSTSSIYGGEEEKRGEIIEGKYGLGKYGLGVLIIYFLNPVLDFRERRMSRTAASINKASIKPQCLNKAPMKFDKILLWGIKYIVHVSFPNIFAHTAK
jgi:hypothetical protein